MKKFWMGLTTRSAPFSSEGLLIFDIVSGRHIHILRKDSVKGADRRKAGGEGDLRNIAPLLQECAGMFDAQTVYEIHKADLDTLL